MRWPWNEHQCQDHIPWQVNGGQFLWSSIWLWCWFPPLGFCPSRFAPNLLPLVNCSFDIPRMIDRPVSKCKHEMLDSYWWSVVGIWYLFIIRNNQLKNLVFRRILFGNFPKLIVFYQTNQAVWSHVTILLPELRCFPWPIGNLGLC